MVTDIALARTPAPINIAPLSPDELTRWLEWAGSTLLAMRLPAVGPRSPSAAWPEFAQAQSEAYGYTGETLRPALPRSYEIQLMDQLLALPSLCTDVTSRRIMNARALVKPITQQHIYSWRRIGLLLHTSPGLVRRRHAQGLTEVIKALPRVKVHAFRQLILAYTI